MRRGPIIALAAVWLAALVAGCGAGAGESSDGGASVTVTRNFGEDRVGQANVARVAGGETVMRLLQRRFDVATRYGGNFVQGIEGVSGGRDDGRPVDWFYYVNGIEAEMGAAERKLSGGDRVWWDHHDWGAAMRVPAVVGSFPEPFLSGQDGKRFPVRLECAQDAGRACDEVQTRLEQAGIKGLAKAVISQPVGVEVLRVIVGPWSQVRVDPAARVIERGPRASGVYARFSDSGRRLDVLDARGRTSRTLGPGAGLVAATRYENQQPTWVVTGIDDVGVAAAAAVIDAEALRNRFALAIDEGRRVEVPAAPEEDL